MKDSVQDIKRKLAENLANDKTAKTDLENDIATVTKLLETGNLELPDDNGARYYQAAALSRLGTLREEKGQPQDRVAARREFAQVIMIAVRDRRDGWTD